MTSAMIGMLRVFTPVAIAIVMLDGLGLLGKIFGS
mgnify:CR=1 FL=1